MTNHVDSGEVSVKIDQVLLESANLFQDPKQLPPRRPGHDHRIPLIQGSNPFILDLTGMANTRKMLLMG